MTNDKKHFQYVKSSPYHEENIVDEVDDALEPVDEVYDADYDYDKHA